MTGIFFKQKYYWQIILFGNDLRPKQSYDDTIVAAGETDRHMVLDQMGVQWRQRLIFVLYPDSESIEFGLVLLRYGHWELDLFCWSRSRFALSFGWVLRPLTVRRLCPPRQRVGNGMDNEKGKGDGMS